MAAPAALPDRSWEHVRSAVVAMLRQGPRRPGRVPGRAARRRTARSSAATARLPVPLGGGPRPRRPYLLGLLQDPATSPRWCHCCPTPSPEVRLVTVRSLGLIGDAAAAARGPAAVPSQGGRIGRAGVGGGRGPDRHGPRAWHPSLRAALASAGPGRARRRRDGDRRRPPFLPVPRAAGPAGARPVAGGPHRARRCALGRLGGPADVAARSIRQTAPSQPAALRRTCVAALGELGGRRRAAGPEPPAGGAGSPTGRAQRRGAGADRAVGGTSELLTAARGIGPARLGGPRRPGHGPSARRSCWREPA